MSGAAKKRREHLKILESLVGRDIRGEFHNLLGEIGFNPNPNMQGGSYNSSHVETLWEVFMRAVLLERTHSAVTNEPLDPLAAIVEYLVTPTDIAASLICSYLQANFHVWGPTPFHFNVGKPSADLHALLENNGTTTAAFITAYNPLGQSLDTHSNESKHRLLLADIETYGLEVIEGEGRDPKNEWPGERSLLILGIDKTTAIEIGNRYQQNAIVWIEWAKPSSLLMLR